jgi:hypothetical protein
MPSGTAWSTNQPIRNERGGFGGRGEEPRRDGLVLARRADLACGRPIDRFPSRWRWQLAHYIRTPSKNE